MMIDLVWITPEADDEIAYMARVSNPNAQRGDSPTKLIKYLIDHKHWSPFEMACMCVQIETTRDIARQILRHRSFHFQEFSQRYSVVPEEPEFCYPRLKDDKNRQNSICTDDPKIIEAWSNLQKDSWECDYARYEEALKLGVAKELARKLLPEGLTRTKMYMQGTIRDWLHYISIRQGPETQLEHQQIAYKIGLLLEKHCPNVARAAINANLIKSFCVNE